MMVGEHPTAEQLTAFGLGKLDDAASTAVEAHLAECETCRRALETQAADSFVGLARAVRAEERTAADAAAHLIPPGEPTCAHSGATAPETAEAPPELAGHPRYRILGLLGVGGMGAVFKAEHLLMQRVVALKVINRRLVANPAMVERFTREVIAAGSLSHPNIVQYHDADHVGETHFLVMEYVEGVNLAKLMAQAGPLPIAQACDIARQAALGLQHAFERGMVHRDVKPANILLAAESSRTAVRGLADVRVKILDFGLARLAQESAPVPLEPTADTTADADRPTPPSALTQVGTVMGTPDYIAPEQARDAHAADVRSDIYSLGCTLYDLLTGRPPFPDGTAMQKVIAHLERSPRPLTELRPEVPAGLARVVEKMLAKDPARRYQSPAEVAEALAPFAPRHAEPTPRRRRRWPWAAAGVAVCGLALALTLLLPPVQELAQTVIRIATNTGELVIEADDNDIEIRIKQPGKEPLVEVIDRKTQRRFVLSAGGGMIEAKELPDGARFKTTQFELARAGKTTLTATLLLADRPVVTMTADGEWVARTDGLPVHVIAISPDGKLVAAGGGAWPIKGGGWQVGNDVDVRLLDRATGKELHRLKGPRSWVSSLSFSPDGRLLAANGTTDGKAYLWDTSNGELLHTLTGHGESVLGVAFSPAGTELWTASWDGTLRRWDMATGREVMRLGTQAGVSTHWHTVVPLPDGKQVVAGGLGQLLVLDVETDTVVRRFEWNGPGDRIEQLALSPDGRWLLTPGTNAGSVPRLWDVATGKLLCEFDTARPPSGIFFRNAFLPDGQRFLTTTVPPGGKLPTALVLLNAQTGEALQTFFKGHSDIVPAVAVAPDGSFAISGGVDQTVRLWKLPAGPASADRDKGTLVIENGHPTARLDVKVVDTALMPRLLGGFLKDFLNPKGELKEIPKDILDAFKDNQLAPGQQWKLTLKEGQYEVTAQSAPPGIVPQIVRRPHVKKGEETRLVIGAVLGESPELPEFQPMFSDKSLKGWKGDVEAWDLTEQTVVPLKQSKSIYTVKAYENYELTLQYRRQPGSLAAVLLHHDGTGGPTGPHFQLSLDDKYNKAPSLVRVKVDTKDYKEVPLEREPTDGWNDLRIVSQVGKLTVYVNEQLRIVANGCDPHKGFIGLLNLRGTTEFRHLRIRELPPASSAFGPLFNGNDLSGWQGTTKQWRVEDKQLVGKAGKDLERIYLLTAKDYEDYELRLEYRFAAVVTGAKLPTDASILFHGIDREHQETPVFAVGLSRESQPGIVPAYGAKHGTWSSEGQPRKPKDGWNEVRIVSRQGSVKLYFNGELIETRQDCWPRKGYVGLENLGSYEVCFRNIEIKELSPTSAD